MAFLSHAAMNLQKPTGLIAAASGGCRVLPKEF
jgi:hypothetical protein